MQGPAGAQGPQGEPGSPGAAGSLDCADELRIQAAAPSFVLSAECVPPPPPCSDPEPDTSGTALYLGPVSGNNGPAQINRNGSICTADEDWFRFRLTDDSSAFFTKDLTAEITLTMAAGGGELDLCVTNVNSGVQQCSNQSGTATEVVDVAVTDSPGSDHTTDFLVQILGFPPATATNTYTHTIRGDTNP